MQVSYFANSKLSKMENKNSFCPVWLNCFDMFIKWTDIPFELTSFPSHSATGWSICGTRGRVQTTWTNEGAGRVAQMTTTLNNSYLVKVST